jgi:hypothetical protein
LVRYLVAGLGLVVLSSAFVTRCGAVTNQDGIHWASVPPSRVFWAVVNLWGLGYGLLLLWSPRDLVRRRWLFWVLSSSTVLFWALVVARNFAALDARIVFYYLLAASPAAVAWLRRPQVPGET